MVISIGILLVAVIIAMVEVPPLRKKGLKKELWIFSILLLVGTGLSIAESLQVAIPNPLDGITMIYKPFSDFLFGLLE